MTRKMITSISLLVIVLAFGQDNFEGGGVRLSPRLLNYQGFITDTLGNQVNGSFDILFRIYDDSVAGNLLWAENQLGVPISKGIFHVLLGSVTSIPDSVLTKGPNRWLALRLSSQDLSPRTRIVSSPYSITATISDTALYARNSAPDNDWVYRITDGADTTLQTGGRWGIARFGSVLNSYSDSTHVNLGVACTTGVPGYYNKYCTVAGGRYNAARMELSAIGGGDRNTATGYAATVGGGKYNVADGYYAVICGGDSNTAAGWNANVGGGWLNSASGNCAVVAGGGLNTGSAPYSAIGGGGQNTVSGPYTTIGGGRSNSAAADYAAIGGGLGNSVNADYATVAGGDMNIAGDTFASVVGGFRNKADGKYSIIGGGLFNLADGDYSAILNGYADTIASSGSYSYLFGINSDLYSDSTFMVDMPHVWFGTDANGYEFPRSRGANGQVMITNGAGILSWGGINYVDSARIAGNAHKLQGKDTTALDTRWVNEGQAAGGDLTGTYPSPTIANGAVTMAKINQAGATAGQVIKWNGAAWQPAADSFRDNDWIFTISDGADTSLQIGGRWGLTRPGNGMLGNTDSTHVNFGCACTTGNNSTNRKYITISGGYSNWAYGDYASIGGGRDNWAMTYGTVAGGVCDTAGNSYATVGGGYANVADGSSSVIAGGEYNSALGANSIIGGGDHNLADSNNAVICGGTNNTAHGSSSTVSGGINNTANRRASTVGGGASNTAASVYSFVGGGLQNTASNEYATVCGGTGDTASGYYSVVAGGQHNVASDYWSAVGGGALNYAGQRYATVAGGRADTVTDYYSFAANYSTKVAYQSSAAFTTSHATADNQVRAAAFSTGTLDIAMDHPDDPMNKILNQYGVASDEVMLIYSGSVVLAADGRGKAVLPDYFDDIARNPRIQLTGVGSADVVYVAEDVRGNSFVVGGKPGMKVYWTVNAERKDIHAEIARIKTPVVQEKTNGLQNHSIDDDAMIGIYDDLRQKNPELFRFKTEEGRQVNAQAKTP